MKHTLWSSLTLFTFFLSPLLLAARLNPCEYSSFGFNRVDNINNEPGSAATYGVVLLSGPNLEGAQNAAKKYAELGLTVRVVRDDKVKKNKFKAVAGQFKTRAEAAAHKIEIQEALNLKNLWIIEFTKNLKIVATYKAKTKLKKDPNASGKKEPKNKNPEKKPTNNKKTDDKQTDNKQSDTNLVEKQNSTNEKSTKDSTGEKISSLMNTWNTIMIVYNIGDLRGLNEFIHPKLGVTVFYNPGAFTIFNWYSKIESVIDDHRELKIPPRSCRPLFEDIPKFSCELSSWNKTGCFISAVSPDSFAGMMTEQMFIDLGGDVAVYNKSKKCINATSYSIMQVENEPYGFKYHIYLGFMDGKWYITAIDLVTPCSA